MTGPVGDSAASEPVPSQEEPHRDWATSAVDRIVDGVQTLRRITTQPILTVARFIVYGLVAAACVIAALVLVGIGLFRLLDLVIPGESWLVHLVFGSSFCVVGSLFWSRRNK